MTGRYSSANVQVRANVLHVTVHWAAVAPLPTFRLIRIKYQTTTKIYVRRGMRAYRTDVRVRIVSTKYEYYMTVNPVSKSGRNKKKRNWLKPRYREINYQTIRLRTYVHIVRVKIQFSSSSTTSLQVRVSFLICTWMYVPPIVVRRDETRREYSLSSWFSHREGKKCFHIIRKIGKSTPSRIGRSFFSRMVPIIVVGEYSNTKSTLSRLDGDMSESER